MTKIAFIQGQKVQYYQDAIADLAAASVTVKDDDSAASNGSAVNVVPETDSVMAYLESTTAGDADTSFTDSEGGIFFVNDNDSPGGVQLYFDEDADADGRFMAVLPAAQDAFIMNDQGGVIKVVHNADAASDGVAVYIDDDGATVAERLLFVGPNDEDGSGDLDHQTPQAFETKINAILAAMRTAGIINSS